MRFRIVRTRSDVGQDLGQVGIVETDEFGRAVFALDGHGPGEYEVREIVPDGYYPTTGAVQTVEVGFGAGDTVYTLDPFGNAPDEVDVAKIDVHINLPDRIDARQPFTVEVPVTIINHGPADLAKVIDSLTLEGRLERTGEIDCAITPLDGPFHEVLPIGEPVPLVFHFQAVCETPSDHIFTAVDDLRLDDPPLTDIDKTNNTMSATARQPVWAETDVSSSTSVDCPARTDVEIAVDCTVKTTVTNIGFSVIDTTTAVDLTGLSDCTVTPLGTSTGSHAVSLDDGESATFVDTYSVSCTDRSFHPFTATATVAADDPHVIDTNPANNTSSAQDTVEVFEAADLGVVDVDVFLACNEYFEADPFGCTATARITNGGPADQVVSDVTLDLTADNCEAVPNPQLVDVVIPVGGSVEIEEMWSVTCTDAEALHVIALEVCVTNDDALDPHAEDRNPANDCADVVALPIDLKPLSDPNTLLLGRGGQTSVAILSTATFDPMTEVDTSRPVLFGPTGTEAEAVRCANEGEDANRDGFDQDLVCLFNMKDLDLSTEVEYLYLTGYLVDGTRFIATEQVRVIDPAA